MRSCPTCGTLFGEDVAWCPACGRAAAGASLGAPAAFGATPVPPYGAYPAVHGVPPASAPGWWLRTRGPIVLVVGAVGAVLLLAIAAALGAGAG